MITFVAFLRAINVGGRVVKMERLREVFSSLGFERVETFIASGNVIFAAKSGSAAQLEKKIEAALERELGYAVRTFLRTDAEVVALASCQPSRKGGEGRLFIGFLEKPPTREAQEKLLAAETEIDEFEIVERELYWRIRGNSSNSKFFGPLLEKTLGVAATIRNANTVRRLAEKFQPSAK
ncbi:DUF1697 domain-containing protein [soil metagenome]